MKKDKRRSYTVGGQSEMTADDCYGDPWGDQPKYFLFFLDHIFYNNNTKVTVYLAHRVGLSQCP